MFLQMTITENSFFPGFVSWKYFTKKWRNFIPNHSSNTSYIFADNININAFKTVHCWSLGVIDLFFCNLTTARCFCKTWIKAVLSHRLDFPSISSPFNISCLTIYKKWNVHINFEPCSVASSIQILSVWNDSSSVLWVKLNNYSCANSPVNTPQEKLGWLYLKRHMSHLFLIV